MNTVQQIRSNPKDKYINQTFRSPKGISTHVLHTSYIPNNQSGDIVPPIHISTTFKFGNEGSYDYSRSGNPTRTILENTLAALDEVKFGLAFSSGSAVLSTIVASLQQGEEILFSSNAYDGLYRFIVNVAGKQGVSYKIIDLTSDKEVKDALEKGKITYVWIETPTNPLMKVTDIELLSEQVHRHGAILIVDNTLATPVIQKPASLGADVVVYSTSKYINGHNDVVGGALVTDNENLYEKYKYIQSAMGAVLSPFDSWLTLRGLRTLELRIQRHGENAQAIATYLAHHKKISKVHYPGLATGKDKKIVEKQMKSGGGMLSIEMDPRYNISQFIESLRYFTLAVSLGGVESLISHPASMTHASIPKNEQERAGISEGLVRISVGIENKEDLLEDLRLALEKLN